MCTILFATESSKPLYTLDTDMTWTFDNVQSRLDANLGIHGAKQHLRLNLVDHMFPFLYAPLLALLHVRRGNSRVFVMLSLLAGILDLVENRVIRGLLLSYIEGKLGGAPDTSQLHRVTPAKFVVLSVPALALAWQFAVSSCKSLSGFGEGERRKVKQT